MKTDCRFSPRLLWEYEEGLLDERRRVEVERHLSECETCRARANDDRELFAKLRNQRPLAAPETARPPQWENRPAAGFAARWRWPVTVVGVAVLAFVAFGVFRIAGGRGSAPTGSTLEPGAAPSALEKAEAAPTDDGSVAERPTTGVEAPVPGSAGSMRGMEQARESVRPRPEPRVNLGRDGVLPHSKPTLPRETEAGMETNPSPPGTAGTPPSETLGDGSLVGGPRGSGGGGFRAAADKAQTQAVVTALADDGKVLAVAELDASNRVSIVEQDGTKLSFDLGKERMWSGRPAYLDRLITLSETGSLGVLSKAISQQAAVPVEVREAVQSQVITVHLSEVQLGLALANIALASETEWKAEKDRVVISPLIADPAVAKAGRGTQEQASTKRVRALSQQMREGNLMMQQSHSMDTACPWCGRPHLGPLWRYCPFCGQPLKGKP